MRMLLVVMVLATGCQHDVAEQPAHSEKIVVAQKPAAVTKLSAPDLANQQTGKDQTAPKACGGAGEACGPGCTGGTEANPTWAVLPAGTPWTALHVTGMHCGECAKTVSY